MTAQVIVVANRKGGVGKTTTTVNLAAELAARDRRGLVVDLDAQGHAGLGLGVPASPRGPYAHDALRGPRVFSRDDARPSVVAGLDVLPADPAFRPGFGGRDPKALARALRPLAADYDDILIDVSPTLDETLVAALAACDRVVIPTQLNHLAQNGVTQFARALFQALALVNRGLADVAVLPTQADLRVTMQREVLARLARDFGLSRILGAIRVDVALAEAFGAGVPARLYRPHSRGAADYSATADRLLDLWGQRARLTA